MSPVFVGLQINFTTSCATVIFFVCVRVCLEPGVQSGQRYRVYSRKHAEEPPAIKTRRHTHARTHTPKNHKHSHRSEVETQKTNQRRDGQIVSPQNAPDRALFPMKLKVVLHYNRKRFDACQNIIKNFSTMMILKPF